MQAVTKHNPLYILETLSENNKVSLVLVPRHSNIPNELAKMPEKDCTNAYGTQRSEIPSKQDSDTCCKMCGDMFYKSFYKLRKKITKNLNRRLFQIHSWFVGKAQRKSKTQVAFVFVCFSFLNCRSHCLLFHPLQIGAHMGTFIVQFFVSHNTFIDFKRRVKITQNNSTTQWNIFYWTYSCF